MHVALVTQNADLELDLRPRAEAEALAAAGFRVTLVGGTRNPKRVRELTKENVSLALYPMPRPAGSAAGQVVELSHAFVAMTRALLHLSRSISIDVVHASNPPDNVWLALGALRATQESKPRFVFDQHDVAPVLLEEKYGHSATGKAFGLPMRSLERASFAKASLVVFANDEYERRARAEGLLRGPAEVVPNGWSLPPAPTSEHWRGDAEHLLAYVGAINEQDYVEHLVEAVARLPRPETVRVCVAGDGAARGAAQRRAEELGVEHSFHWLGWVYRREEMGSLVRSADVCVAPEVDSDFNRLASFVKLVEYMSVAAPIAAHRLAQNVRLCGETVEYADDMSAAGLAAALGRLLAEKERARSLGEAARKRFEASIAWESVGALRLVEAYRTVFAEGRIPANQADTR
ncbi:MAG: glycosyltransferase [Gaiellaceae bacterium]